MGMVAATFRIMPEEPKNVGAIKEHVKKAVDVKELKEVPVGFGITLLEVLLVFDDSAGIGSVEEKLKSIDGVASVESGDVTLL
jgi:translation elongation factor aEF-1 beta